MRGLLYASLNSLLVFHEVAKHKNFSKAAEEMFISQPAVTKHIKELERKVGMVLIQRGKGGLADLLIIAGATGSLIAVSRLGGAFSMLPEARRLVTSGPYAVVRHPLYLAEMIGVLGLVLQFQQPWSLFLGAGVFVLQYWRSIFEERILMEAYPDYVVYRARTWRFVPYVF